jgi:hypothetical protein
VKIKFPFALPVFLCLLFVGSAAKCDSFQERFDIQNINRETINSRNIPKVQGVLFFTPTLADSRDPSDALDNASNTKVNLDFLHLVPAEVDGRAANAESILVMPDGPAISPEFSLLVAAIVAMGVFAWGRKWKNRRREKSLRRLLREIEREWSIYRHEAQVG